RASFDCTLCRCASSKNGLSKAPLPSVKTLISRRTALKTVISGAMAAGPLGCDSGDSARRSAAGLRAATALAEAGGCPMHVRGESFDHAHSKRDGNVFPKSDVKESFEIAIVGGGPSGLCALHALQDRDVVLLEKEDHLGGNCSSDSWEGVSFSTGAA